MSRSVPRIVIAGTQSGTGKTSLSLALVASLKRRGLRVQTFKVGPDFLDPTYLTLASERPCYNLDGWMTPMEYILELFHRTTRDADIAVVEGVMGLFDGSGQTASNGSTAEITRLLEAPVILILNAHGMGQSLAALVKGFVEFDRSLKVAGIIANHCGSKRHQDLLSQSLKDASLPPLLGAIPRGALPTLPSRHLGLIPADKRNLSTSLLESLAMVFEKHLSIDEILRIATQAPFLSDPHAPALEVASAQKRISLGLAYDRAFHFYYPDNLRELELRGCDLVRFSPLEERYLPEGLHGLYFGGGYPEEYAEALADNQQMKEAIRQFAKRGMPIYAECGGLMYLTEGIETLDGRRFPMVGLIPTWSKMLNRLSSLGYVEVTLREHSLWGECGDIIRGHEFHYSELTSDLQDERWKTVYSVRHARSKRESVEGFQHGNILASYIHLHWASKPKAMNRFITQFEESS